MKILVDTNILIDFTHGYSKELKDLLIEQQKGSIELFINPIIQAEFLADKNLKRKELLNKALKLLDSFQMLPITRATGIIAGEIIRKGLSSTLADAFIAGSCIEHAITLYTRNTKHFKNIPNLKLFNPQT